MVRHIFFGLCVLAQLAILAVKPTEKLIIRHVTGGVITLQTVPVDPYDVMRGYYMTLRYEISDPPEFKYSREKSGATVYTLLKKGPDGVWHGVSVSDEIPTDLEKPIEPGGPARERAVIRGTVAARRSHGPIRYGIEEYFVPEEMRHEIERDISREGQRILVDVAVDPKGRSSILRLHVGDKTYEY